MFSEKLSNCKVLQRRQRRHWHKESGGDIGYKWKPGAYKADTSKFEICATYRAFDGTTGTWFSGDVGFSFIAIGY